MNVAAGVVIPASPAEIWNIWSDLEGWPDWNPVALDISLRGPLDPGTVVDMRLRHPRGRPFWTRPVIDEVAPERALGWTAKGMGLRARTLTTLEVVDEGTKLRMVGDTSGLLAFTYRIAMTRKVQGKLFLDTLNAFAARMTP